jgi:hypothetical protein
MVAGLVLAGGVLVVVLGPGVRDAKEDNAAAERREAAERSAARLARLRSEIRPRLRRAPALATPADGSPGRVPKRRALVGELEQAVLADARARSDSGELGARPRDAECERFPRTAAGPPPEDDPSARTSRYECLAVTSRFGRRAGERGSIGYPFRARVDFARGAYGFCKISGRPGEGALKGQPLVRVPRACGGT